MAVFVQYSHGWLFDPNSDPWWWKTREQTRQKSMHETIFLPHPAAYGSSQARDLSHRGNLCHSCCYTGSLTYCTRQGQRQRQILNPLCYSGNSKPVPCWWTFTLFPSLSVPNNSVINNLGPVILLICICISKTNSQRWYMPEQRKQTTFVRD